MARRWVSQGAAYLHLVDLDGARQGFPVNGASVRQIVQAAGAELAGAVPLPGMASGGVTPLDDIRKLARLGLAGCIVGRALYEGRLDLTAIIREAASIP